MAEPKEVDKSEEARSRLRISEQAALMLNARYLIGKKADDDTDSQINYKDYKNFCAFRTDQSGEFKDIDASGLTGGGHISLTNKLYRTPATKVFFKKATTSILSSLSPSIKLYKTFFPNHGNSTKADRDSVSYSWRIPFDDLSFESNNASEYSQFVDNTDEILKGSGRGHGVGIKSFNYSYIGTNPAEVNTNISAQLELYFQDVNDLIKEIKFQQDDKGFVGETNLPTSDFQFSYSDLVVDSSSKTKQRTSNERYFRLKAIVGYNEPSENYWKHIQSSGELTDEEFKEIKIAIKNAQVILYLNPHNHSIEFQDNGTISLKIEYIAAITSIMSSLDCLAISSFHDKLRYTNEAFESRAKEHAAEVDKRAEVCEKPKEQDPTRQNVLDAELELENARNSLVSEIFQRIIGLNQEVSNVYQADFSAEALGINEKGKLVEDSTQRRIENLGKSFVWRYRRLASKEIKKGPLAEQYNSGIVKDGSINWLSTFNPWSSDKITEKDIETAANKFNEKAKRDKLDAVENSELFGVQFVFLGQLFDIFCEIINKELKDPSEKPRIVLNDFSIEIPVKLKNPTVNGKTNTETINKSMTLNMVDIPISLAMLQQLFIEKIVKPKRTRYPLAQFINDIMTDVVAPAVSPSVFGSNTKFNTSVRMSSLNLSLPFLDSKDCITGKDKKDNFGGVVNEKDTANLDIAINYGNSITNNIGNYLFVYCSSQLPNIIKTANGDEDKDEKNGIYHIRIGSDRGILKKISFSKTDVPFSKEMRAQTSTGDKSVDRIREVYDSNVSLFGNNIFKPGDYIYIEPLIFSGKQAVDIQNKIGLGGYYQVITVKTSMIDNTYETSLETKLAGHINENPDNSKIVVSEAANKGC